MPSVDRAGGRARDRRPKARALITNRRAGDLPWRLPALEDAARVALQSLRQPGEILRCDRQVPDQIVDALLLLDRVPEESHHLARLAERGERFALGRVQTRPEDAKRRVGAGEESL